MARHAVSLSMQTLSVPGEAAAESTCMDPPPSIEVPSPLRTEIRMPPAGNRGADLSFGFAFGRKRNIGPMPGTAVLGRIRPYDLDQRMSDHTYILVFGTGSGNPSLSIGPSDRQAGQHAVGAVQRPAFVTLSMCEPIMNGPWLPVIGTRAKDAKNVAGTVYKDLQLQLSHPTDHQPARPSRCP